MVDELTGDGGGEREKAMGMRADFGGYGWGKKRKMNWWGMMRVGKKEWVKERISEGAR